MDELPWLGEIATDNGAPMVDSGPNDSGSSNISRSPPLDSNQIQVEAEAAQMTSPSATNTNTSNGLNSSQRSNISESPDPMWAVLSAQVSHQAYCIRSVHHCLATQPTADNKRSLHDAYMHA